MRGRPLVGLLLLSALLALSGCTQSGSSASDFKGEQKKVAQVVEDLEKAAGRNDGTKICEDVYSDELAKRIAGRDPKRTCGQVVKDSIRDVASTAKKLDVKKVTIEGTKATAVVESKSGDDKRTDDFSLTRIATGWRISSVGR